MKLFPPSAVPIWVGSETVDQYAAFRFSFENGSDRADAELLVSSDTDFIAWVNGREATRGQYPDPAGPKSFNRVKVGELLKNGVNSIAILAHHAGKEFFTVADGPAFMCCALVDGEEVLAASGCDWKCNSETGWRNGTARPRTMQLGFTTEFDHRTLPGWQDVDFDDSKWRTARETGLELSWRERPVSPCVLGEFEEARKVAAGTFSRKNIRETVAETMSLDDYGATAGADGEYAVFDLGRESVGFIVLEMDAPAGTLVDYAHGERLTNNLVDMFIDGRCFADRCIAPGESFRHELLLHRCGLRYIQVNVLAKPGSARIRRVGILPWNRELPAPAKYESDDPLVPKLREAAIRTLELCMHDHFEDCPWREQSMYGYDSRNQSLFGYRLWGNGGFVKASYALLADSWRKNDRQLGICSPGSLGLSIPMFTFAWIFAMKDLYVHTGDRSLFDERRDMAKAILDDSLSRLDDRTGLYHCGKGKWRWNFYEWVDGLQDVIGRECPPDEYHAAYNMYLAEALDSAGKMLGEETYLDKSRRLRKAVHDAFFDASAGNFASILAGNHLSPLRHDHIQYLALAGGAVMDDDERKAATGSLYSGKLIPATFSCLPYMLMAMMPMDAGSRRYAARLIRRQYAGMMEAGATSLWETPAGPREWNGAGSMCHGWSAIPIWYWSSCVLGVRPTSPGFKTFSVTPYADEWTTRAKGEIPTPFGNIGIEWHLEGGKIRLSVDSPRDTRYLVYSYPECPVI